MHPGFLEVVIRAAIVPLSSVPNTHAGYAGRVDDFIGVEPVVECGLGVVIGPARAVELRPRVFDIEGVSGVRFQFHTIESNNMPRSGEIAVSDEKLTSF